MRGDWFAMDCVVSHMISLSFLRFSVRSFERGRKCSREVFVLLLIFPRLVQIQFRNRVARDLCISRSVTTAVPRRSWNVSPRILTRMVTLL